MLKLFISPGACALASHIALEEAGADFETRVVDLRTGQQRTPEYLAVNPAGSTPALQTDRGVITQNPAILAFVAQTHPDRNLAPIDDPHAFAAFNAFNGFLSSSLHPAIGKVLFSRPPLEAGPGQRPSNRRSPDINWSRITGCRGRGSSVTASPWPTVTSRSSRAGRGRRTCWTLGASPV